MTTTEVGITGHRFGRGPLRVAALVLASIIVVGPLAVGGAAQQAGEEAAQQAAAPPNPCPDRPGQVTFDGTWFRAKAPSFPIGPQEITTYALEFLADGIVYVTNGKAVARSRDLGCHWEVVYQLPAAPDAQEPFSASNSTITMIRTSIPGFAYLGIQEGGTAPRAHVMRTSNGGNEWLPARGGELETAVGQFRDLAVTTFDPGTLYALVDVEENVGPVEIEAGQILFGSDDGGQSWEQRAFFNTGKRVNVAGAEVELPFGELDGLEADPFRSDTVWIFGTAGTFRSEDGGSSTIATALPPLGEMDIFRAAPGQAATIHAFARDSATVYRSTDDGQTFTPAAAPGVVDSAGHGAIPDAIAIGTGGRVYLLVNLPGTGGLGAVDVSPIDGHPIHQVQAAIPLIIMGHAGTTIDYLDLGVPPEDDDPLPIDPVTLTPGDLKEFGDGNIRPARSKVILRQKQLKVHRYQMLLPPSPTPLDVYFLIDVSGSMSNTINGVRRGMQEIIDRLGAEGIDVHFGVGSYRAFGDPPSYDKGRDIGPVDDELTAALNSLQARGGGDETQLYAELRSVTATGGNAPTAQDTPMTFRPNSLKVLINATDEPISTGPPHPTYEDVIAALNTAEVKQVGLAIQDPGFFGDGSNDPRAPASGLIRVAEGTDTLAPPTGVDCDGDGSNDLAPGDPVVCVIPPNRSSEAALMADAIVNILDAVVDINTLGIEAFPTDRSVTADSPVVKAITPATLEGVDLKSETLREFSITYRCPKLDERTVFPVEIGIFQGTRVLGSALTDVVCRVRQPDPVPIVTAFVPLLALPLPPVRPPEPVPEPNPNPQPNPQGNPQGQAGLASQEQKQPQLAAVHQQSQSLPEAEEAAGDQQFLMTQHKEKTRAIQPQAVFLTGAVLMTLLYGFATLARQQARTQAARRRPWDR